MKTNRKPYNTDNLFVDVSCHGSNVPFQRNAVEGVLEAAARRAAESAAESYRAGYRAAMESALLSVSCEGVSYSAKTEEGRKTLDRLTATFESQRDYGGL
jgi:hypothetical protein